MATDSRTRELTSLSLNRGYIFARCCICPIIAIVYPPAKLFVCHASQCKQEIQTVEVGALTRGGFRLEKYDDDDDDAELARALVLWSRVCAFSLERKS